jgi:hypothetical protein
MEWFQEKGVEKGDPISIFDEYTLRKRQKLATVLNLPQIDLSLNNG